MSGSRVVRYRGRRWEGVEPTRYSDRPALFRDVVRHTLLGRGEADPGLPFEVRCFELAPGGYSSLERHEHPHAVLVLSGHGDVILGQRVEPVAPWDAVCVAPGELHQFHASRGEPLLFLCVVPRHRDRPRAATPAEIRALAAASPEAARLLHRAGLLP